LANYTRHELRIFLDRKVAEYNQPSFIIDDPVSIPHRFTRKQDIEIAGFFAAIFSWGNRKTIIRKTEELMQLMDQAPWQFVRSHTDKDLKRLLDFKHRTFNATDLLYFVDFFHHHYAKYDSLEDAFLLPWEKGKAPATGRYDPASALSAFHHYFFSLGDSPPHSQPSPDPVAAYEVPPRTRKHIASPEKHSSCKRLNMFLRWMVRKDIHGVDFGLWSRIPANRLICPLDVHVARVAQRFGLLTRERSDWQAAIELTESLSLLDNEDPVKYDFALFGLGVMENF
jgi:uncharacterized protein (TIGR02757 family)